MPAAPSIGVLTRPQVRTSRWSLSSGWASFDLVPWLVQKRRRRLWVGAWPKVRVACAPDAQQQKTYCLFVHPFLLPTLLRCSPSSPSSPLALLPGLFPFLFALPCAKSTEAFIAARAQSLVEVIGRKNLNLDDVKRQEQGGERGEASGVSAADDMGFVPPPANPAQRILEVRA